MNSHIHISLYTYEGVSIEIELLDHRAETFKIKMDRANLPSKVAVPIYTSTYQCRKLCLPTFLPKVDLMSKYYIVICISMINSITSLY